ncbi:MAG: transglycosylase SLT domain-containing protein [Acidobacteria bacterium]|nr:transglycosylase SLT domain-containing protein [Acidobacteriota bacterium]
MLICAWVAPVQAESIVAMVDEHGHTIYVNAPSDGGSGKGVHSFRPVRSPSALPQAEVNRLVELAATSKQVDPKLVHSIIQVESGYDPNAVSRKGAMGLMQLVPGTAKRFGVENPFDPVQNIHGGVSYLKYLLDMFSGDVTLSLAAYNAGENSVLRTGGVPAFRETQDYVRKVNYLYGSEIPAGQPAQKLEAPPKAEIYRYVDEQGIVHFTNGQDF